MASKHMIVFFLIVMACLPSISLAKEFVVGDEAGWRTGYDYTAWAAGKEFRVGDKLVFNYPVGSHNVLRVDGDSYKNCTAPANVKPLETGNDIITLSSPGRKWYICGVGKHCQAGKMQLAITVQENLDFQLHDNMAPSPSVPGGETPNSANGIKMSVVQIPVAAMAAVVMLFIALVSV